MQRRFNHMKHLYIQGAKSRKLAEGNSKDFVLCV